MAHPLDDAIPRIVPGAFDEEGNEEVTQPHVPLPPSESRLLAQLVRYAQLRPACVPRVIANALKHFAMPAVRDDEARVRLERVREHLLVMAAQMDLGRG